MAAVTEQNVVAVELEKVSTKLPKLFERDDKFFATIKKREVEKVSNRQMRIPLQLRPGGNFGYFNPNGGDLGRGGGPQFDKALVTCVFLKEGIEYTKLAEWATDSDRKAVVNAVRKMTADSFDELRRQLDSQMMQNGTGVIGVITSVSTSGTQETYTCTTDGFGVRLMRVGQTIQVFDTTLATNRGQTEIIGLDVNAKTVTVSPVVALSATTDKIVTAGLSAPASLPALYGVPYHHSNDSTGVWLGFNRATTSEVRSNGINAASSPLTLPLPRLAINAVGNRVGIDNNFSPTAWMHPAQVQAYEEIGQLVSIIQKQPKDEKLNMYFGNGIGEGMQLAGAPVRSSFSWDKTRIDFVVEETWGRAEILPIGYYKTDGRSIFEIRGASGGVATADIFYLTVGMQTFVYNPAATSYIYSLAVPSGY